MVKRILDTVHGNIFVDVDYIDNIIDTDLFQRLRRIEQSSIRSIFPSARHDRFVHSLGVFHLGVMIDRQIRRDVKYRHKNNWYNLETLGKETAEDRYREISRSYLTACLLHDIAHAPFSHTFEKYYGDKGALCIELLKHTNAAFANDINSKTIIKIGINEITINTFEDINYHEYASAIVALTAYEQAIQKIHANPDLVARMITGVKFSDVSTRFNQISNGFISLLHGDIIDADRLDYACRDVWASGYATSTIDAQRLISGIHFRLAPNKKIYEVCFESNVLNEIESVISVKDFQMQHVIHHHTVEYEQDLLKRAAEQMAKHFFPTEKDGEAALGKIISVDNVTGTMSLPPYKMLNIKHIADDDLIYLIKNDLDNDYYEEWAKRSYTKFALWKTRTEFFSYFGEIFHWEDDITEDFLRPIIEKVIANYQYDAIRDLRIVKVTFKDKVKMDNLNVFIGNRIIKYNELFKERQPLSLSCPTKEKPFETIFCYVYLTKNKNHKYKTKSFYQEKDDIIRHLLKGFKDAISMAKNDNENVDDAHV